VFVLVLQFTQTELNNLRHIWYIARFSYFNSPKTTCPDSQAKNVFCLQRIAHGCSYTFEGRMQQYNMTQAVLRICTSTQSLPRITSRELGIRQCAQFGSSHICSLLFSTCYWFLFHLNTFFSTHENSCLQLRTSKAGNWNQLRLGFTKMTTEDENRNLWMWSGNIPEYATQEVMKSMGPFKTNMNGIESPTTITMLANMRV
jgi:hypothetical protein